MIVERRTAYNQQDNKGTYKEDTVANAIRARGGMYGGGALTLMIEEKNESVYDARGNGDGNNAPTITGDHQNRVTDYSAIAVEETRDVVRRLTPLECERLQGFPDGWTDIGEWTDSKGKKHETLDSHRYKALGNSIAVGYANNQSGFWMWLIKRISAQYERSATLGSLFDGIGGFPLAWEFYNGKGSAVWASEIEEFCIAVTKRHFPDPEDSCSQAVNVERERERERNDDIRGRDSSDNGVANEQDDGQHPGRLTDSRQTMKAGFDWYQYGGFRESEQSAPVTCGADKVRGGSELVCEKQN